MKCDARQAGAAVEGTLPDAGDAITNRDARQAGAAKKASPPMLVTLSGIVMLVRLVQLSKAPHPDAGDAITNRDARQAGAAVEGLIPDAGDAITNRDARQAGADEKALFPMLVTPSGIVMLVRLVQSVWKAIYPRCW